MHWRVFGGFVYYVCDKLGLPLHITQSISAISVFIARVVSVRYHICLPVLKGED